MTQGSCQAPPAVPGNWRRVIDQFNPAGAQAAAPAAQVTVDPSAPCHLYLSRPQSIQRADGWSATPATVFEDSSTAAAPLPDTGCVAAGCAGGQFHLSGIQLPTAWEGQVLLSENGAGDSVIASPDRATSWSLSNQGIGGLPVQRLYIGYGRRAYAVVGSGTQATTPPASLSPNEFNAAADLGLFMSSDRGATWNPAHLPPTLTGGVDSIAIDPGNDQHLWMSWRAEPGYVVMESTDAGATWIPRSVTAEAGNLRRSQLLAISSHSHALRLFLAGAFLTYQTDVLRSDDGGSTWTAELPPGYTYMPAEDAVIAADPVHQDSVLTVVARSDGNPVDSQDLLHVFYSSDGGDHERTLSAPELGRGRPRLHTALEQGPGDPGQVLQTDRFGNFYLSALITCNAGRPDGCPAHATGERQAMWRFTPPRAGSGSDYGCDQTCLLFGPLTTQSMTEIKTCGLPVQASSPWGSIAFDGRHLLYTQPGGTGPGAYQARVHRLSPSNCQGAGDLVVTFRAADMQAYGAATHSSSSTFDPTQPEIDDLAYDPVRNALWVSLSTVTASTTAPLFRVALDYASDDSRGIASLAFDGCGAYLTYDFSIDALWTCRSDQSLGPIAAASGSTIYSCMSTALTISPVSVGGATGSPATWLIGAPGHMYIQSEDDSTVTERLTGDCSLERTMTHRTFNEPPHEDEQMACDGITFLDAANPSQNAVIWIRDANSESVTAYSVGDGDCPLPTTTTLSPPARVGGSEQSCALLALLGRGNRLGGLTLNFSYDGAPPLSARTDATGSACAPVPAGDLSGAGTVLAAFDGVPAYLPSQDQTTFDFPQAPPPPAPHAFVFAAVQARPAVPPLNPPSESLSQAQALAGQGQPQPQPGGQGQPGAVMQSETQAQVQVARATTGDGAGEGRDPDQGPLTHLFLAAAAMTLVAAMARGRNLTQLQRSKR
ncbi:MAG: WD40/YVTN/BNR-like repeat-containing protein [Candidatus Dormibacteria bacterium]